jgi:fatty-acyl-CoA synthase
MSQEWPGTVIRTVGRSVDGAADLHVRRSVDTGPAGATTTWPIPVVVTLECYWSRRAHDGRAHETDKRSAFVNGEIYLEELVATLKEAGDRTVLEHDGVATTAADLLASTYRYARALDGLGIGRGDLVALHAPNSPDALAVRYAAHLVGAATMYLPALPEAQQRAALLEFIAPDLLIAFPETAHLLPLAATVRVAVVGCDVPGARLRLDRRAYGASSAPLPCRARPDDLAVVISSGGSTGVPKGSLRSFATYTITVTAPADPARRQLANGPLAHLTQLLVDTTLLGGGTVVLQDEVEPAATLAAIESARITDLFLVEPQLFAVIDHPDVATRDLSSLRTVVHIGASAPATLRRRARARLGAVVAHTYGASETGIVSALSPAEHDRPERLTCCGRVRPGVEVRFRRGDGSLAGPGEPGVVEVRSPQLASGYRNRPAEEAAAFVDGWYRTGDVARLDAEGYLHILGRAGDLATAPVRADGTVVTPTAVQDTLCGLPGIRYAVVVPDRDTGRWVAAVVTTATPVAPTVRTAVALAHGAEAADMLVVVPVEQMPLTEQGKPDRPAIRRLGVLAAA